MLTALESPRRPRLGRILALLAWTLLPLGGCDDPTGAARIESVEITAPSDTVVIDRSLQLTATVRDARGRMISDREVTWSSSNSNVATVSPTGLVRGMTLGRTSVTARVADRADMIEIVVARPSVSVASVAIQYSGHPQEGSLVVGEVVSVWVVLRDKEGKPLTDRPVVWSSSDTAVAVISGGPVLCCASLRGVRPGAVTVTAMSEGVRGTAKFTVRSGDRVVLTNSSPFGSQGVALGYSRRLLAELRNVQGERIPTRRITWASSNPAAVSVDSTGTVRGLALGSATVTASAEQADSISTLVYVDRGYLARPLPLIAMALNEAGQVAGTVSDAGAGGSRPALWADGRIVWTGPLSARILSLVLNDSGHVAGTWARRGGDRLRGFFWRNGQLVEIAPPDTAADLHVTGVNNRGQVVGSWARGETGGSAFLWQGGSLVDLGRLGGEGARADGINDRGQVVVTISSPGGDPLQSRVVLLENGSRTEVASGEAVSINRRGDVVGRQGSSAFLWRDGKLTILAASRHAQFYLSGMNAQGEAFGFFFYGSWSTAFQWKEGKLRQLSDLTVSPDGASMTGLSHAFAPNDQRQILAYVGSVGISTKGSSFLLTPIR
jgi:probable HAF family extracellular repeat protein